MSISATQVKELREKTGVGMMECKKALVEMDGDLDKAIDYLRKRGMAKAAKRADRETTQGLVESYIHPGGQVGVLLEVNCETDFVARNEEFQAFVHDLAMHIAATNPLAVREEELDQAVLAKEREVFLEQAKTEGKPEHIAEKIVEGRVNKYKQEVVLLSQPFVKNPDETIEEMVKARIAKIGENITIRRFSRFQIGA